VDERAFEEDDRCQAEGVVSRFSLSSLFSFLSLLPPFQREYRLQKTETLRVRTTLGGLRSGEVPALPFPSLPSFFFLFFFFFSY